MTTVFLLGCIDHAFPAAALLLGMTIKIKQKSLEEDLKVSQKIFLIVSHYLEKHSFRT